MHSLCTFQITGEEDVELSCTASWLDLMSREQLASSAHHAFHLDLQEVI
jgi:hypothetical protein